MAVLSKLKEGFNFTEVVQTILLPLLLLKDNCYKTVRPGTRVRSARGLPTDLDIEDQDCLRDDLGRLNLNDPKVLSRCQAVVFTARAMFLDLTLCYSFAFWRFSLWNELPPPKLQYCLDLITQHPFLDRYKTYVH